MRRHTAVLAAVTMTALALLAAGCGSDSSGSGSGTTTTVGASPLLGPWTLGSYSADGRQVTAADPPASITLGDDGRFTGTTGCNSLAGTWTGDVDGTFRITPGPMTQMACVDQSLQAQETALTTGLPNVADATISADSLTLTDASGAALFTFTRGTEGIVGSYSVTGINNGNGAVVSSAATENATITFADGGTVSGNTGCNSFSGSYTVDGSSLEIDSDVAATMMACEEGAQQVEQQFLTALSEVASWERSGQTVTLRDPAGSIQLALSPAP